MLSPINSFNKLTSKLVTEMAYGLNNFEPLSSEEFVQLIVDFDNSGKGAKPISFTSITSPAHRKTGFPYRKLFKVGQTNGMIGFDYEANVNAQRERENRPADFVAGGNTKVKEWLSRSIAVTNTGLTALRYRPLTPAPSYFVVRNADGSLTEVDRETILPFLYAPPASSGQGVEELVQYRLYGVDKIIAVSFEKKEYVITDVDPEKIEVFDIVKHKLKS